MIRGNNFFLFASVVFLTRINFCLLKPDKPNDISKATNNESKDSIYRKHYATQMLSFMNHSVSPCHDFYEYACGNWKWKGMEDRWTATKRSNIMDIEFKLNDIVENILKRPHINDVAPEYAAEFMLAQQFYNNCLAAEMLPMRASSEYLEVLKEIGGFPAVDTNWKSENFDWLKMSAHLSNYGIDGFVKENIKSDYPFRPFFQMPDLGLGILLDNDTVHDNTSTAYQENKYIMRSLLTIYGVKENHIDSIILEIFNLLKKILRITTLLNEDDNAFLSKLVNTTEIKNKWRMYNSIAWMSKDFDNNTKNSDDFFNPCLFFYKILDKILDKNKRAAANYLSLKFLFHMDAPLSDRKYQKEFCISHVKSSMIHFFDHLYMKLYFNKELRDEISYIIKEIRQSLRNKINEADWMDEATRNAALLKESSMTVQIGRYEDTYLTKLLLGELKMLQFVNGSFEANNLNLRKFKQYMMRFIGLNFEKLSNTTKPLKVLVGMQSDAFYYDLDNSIYIMAGILMPPIYNKDWPNSLKFSTLGFLIGHELTHGFDSFGVNFHEKRNQKNWWSTQSAKKFKERAKCYVNHYKNYFIPEIKLHINGKLTKKQNIADGEGLRLALMAYRRYIKYVNKDLDVAREIYKREQLPGIDLSPEQLFFLSFAQQWCGAYTEADYWNEIRVEHTIDKYRAIGTLSNNADFAETYNCSLGSEMNPKSYKCEIW